MERITKYGQTLFLHFCQNAKRRHITIRAFSKVPQGIRTALFGDPKLGSISLGDITKCFPNLNRLEFNQLNLRGNLEKESADYTKLVLEFITTHKAAKLSKITFQSRRMNRAVRKANARLTSLVEENQNKFTKHRWSVNYQYQNQHAHTLEFTNDVQAAKHVASGISDLHDMCDLVIYQPIPDSVPSYFMQIMAIDAEDVRVHIAMNEIATKTQKVIIRELSNDAAISQAFRIQKGGCTGGLDIRIGHNHAASYRLALFHRRDSVRPLPNSSIIHFEIEKNEQALPPTNKEYRPQPIDVSSVLTVATTDKVSFFWVAPSGCFGEISYRIANDDAKQSEDEELIVECLPYSVSVPVSSLNQSPPVFRVFTRTMIGGSVYESDASEAVTVCNIASDENQSAELSALEKPSSLRMCSKEQIFHLFTSNALFATDECVKACKHNIADYLTKQAIDGQRLVDIGKQVFIEEVSAHSQSANIREAASRSFDIFVKFQFASMSK